jgi:hypothetical protein
VYSQRSDSEQQTITCGANTTSVVQTSDKNHICC